MVFRKINTLFEKNNFNNVIKVFIILIGLYILYRIFTDNNLISSNYIEGFTSPPLPAIFGNSISLSDKTNIPGFTASNQCTFDLDGTYRINTIKLTFNTKKNDVVVKFLDGSGNMKFIKANDNKASPPKYNTNNDGFILLKDITDENGLTVYTNKIVVITTDTTTSSTKIITKYEIYGGGRSLPSITDFTNYLGNASDKQLTKGGINNDNIQGIDSYTFSTGENQIMYILQLTNANSQISSQTSTSSGTQTTTSSGNTSENYSLNPFELTIKYYNTIYPDSEFTVKSKYIIRNDTMSYNTSPNNITFIYLDEPIIANKLIIDVSRTNIMNSNKLNKLDIINAKFYGNTPTANDINLYKKNVNITMQDQETDGDVCPGINEIADKQSKTQQICDNLEYQDKIKSEKLRMERNKQYLLKLKQQQEEIDELNTVINDLETKRQGRAQIADQTRVLNYQKQKESASRVRDLANQRLQIQDLNKLYMDVKINNV